MTFDNWQTVATLFFFVGVGAGLFFAVVIGQIFWKISAFYCTAQAAARIAEASCQEAQIRVNERTLLEQRERLNRMFAEIGRAEDAQEAVPQ